MQTIFSESGITISVDDSTNHFRFSECAGYTKLKGFSFKEMDVCVFPKATNTLLLIELKQYLNFPTNKSDFKSKTEGIVWNLVKKSVDSLSMVLAVREQTSYAQQTLEKCLPQKIDANTKLHFIIIMDCSPSQTGHVKTINEVFQNRFKPYAELFGIRGYIVASKLSAAKFLPNSFNITIT